MATELLFCVDHNGTCELTTPTSGDGETDEND